MSNYTKTTDFDVKDSLPSGDTGKIIRGSEFEVEFENIEVAIASKADSLNTVLTGTTTATNLSVTGNTTLGNAASDTVTVNADFSSDLLPSADATYDLGAPGSEWQDLYVTGTANIDSLVADTVAISGGTITATLTGNVTGNLTGTVLTAAQPNITSVGTLTSATVENNTTTGGLIVATAQGDVTVPATSSSLDFARAGSSYIRATDAAGNFRFITGANDFVSTRLFLANNGDVSFFEDTGVTAKLFWDASTESLGIGTSSPATNLHVSDATEAQIYLSDTGGAGATSANSQLVFTHGAGNTNNAYIGNDQNVVTGAFSMGTLVNYPMSFVINSSEVMRIDNSGRVGIGTTTPNDALEVRQDQNGETEIAVNNLDTGANASANLLLQADGNNFRIKNFGDGTSTPNLTQFLSTAGGSEFAFSPNNSERMRIDSAGNVGIGTDSPASQLHVNSSTANGDILISEENTNTDCRIRNSNGILILDSDLNSEFGGSGIRFNVDGTERARIDTSGNLLVGKTAVPADTSGAAIFGSGSTTDGTASLNVSVGSATTTTSNRLVNFRINATAGTQGTASGAIVANGASQAAFSTYSDLRLKENVSDLPSQLDSIVAMRPVEFDYKDGSGHQVGFIAQEIQEVYPDCVGEDSEGFLTVAGWSKTEARLVKAIQELSAELNSVKAELAALRSN